MYGKRCLEAIQQRKNMLFANRGLVARTMRASYVSEVDLDSETEIRGSSREPSVNSVTLLGRVGTHPETISMNLDGGFTTFRLATNTGQLTDWHQINVGFSQGSKYVSDNVRVGDRVLVRGRLGYSTSKQKQTFSKIYATQVILVNRSRKHREETYDEESD